MNVESVCVLLLMMYCDICNNINGMEYYNEAYDGGGDDASCADYKGRWRRW